METTVERLTGEELISALNWRYATKKFDPERNLDDQQVDVLLESLRLSASSMGLQPYEFIHVKNPEIREQLKEHSHGQTQITDASELIVFAAKTKIGEEHIEDYARLEGELRDRSEDQIQRKIAGTLDYVNRMDKEQLFNWNSRQVYIAMGTLLSAAALMGIDACPMEGIKGEDYDRILQLEALNLRSLAVVTLGYRSSDDSYASQPKFRFPRGRIIKTI
ncbi:nitroreductase family protein [Cryomorphaceae bacterium 1068]|nr:nitroreductase family protein [Cryomorphaceae bacterium 1068]